MHEKKTSGVSFGIPRDKRVGTGGYESDGCPCYPCLHCKLEQLNMVDILLIIIKTLCYTMGHYGMKRQTGN